MKISINGTDITPYLAKQGEALKYTRNDIDGPNAGRALDGTMYRDRVTVKDKWTVTLAPLSADNVATVMNLIYPEYVTVTINPHPLTGASRTFEAYSNNVPAQYLIKKGTKEYWTGISFPLIER